MPVCIFFQSSITDDDSHSHSSSGVRRICSRPDSTLDSRHYPSHPPPKNRYHWSDNLSPSPEPDLHPTNHSKPNGFEHLPMHQIISNGNCVQNQTDKTPDDLIGQTPRDMSWTNGGSFNELNKALIGCDNELISKGFIPVISDVLKKKGCGSISADEFRFKLDEDDYLQSNIARTPVYLELCPDGPGLLLFFFSKCILQ